MSGKTELRRFFLFRESGLFFMLFVCCVGFSWACGTTSNGSETPANSEPSGADAGANSDSGGSGGTVDPKAVWDKVGSKYRSWNRAPGFPKRHISTSAHGDEVDMYVNDVVQKVFDEKKKITSWPVGSVIMKDGYKNGKLRLIAWMEKRADGWVWIEWDDKMKPLYQGRPSICTGCHSAGDDFVRAFSFPK